MEEHEETRFLPPEPAGPEPDLGKAPPAQPPPPPPPPAPQTYGYPPPGQGYPPPGQGYPPPGHGYPPPGHGYPPPGQGYPPPWGYPQPPVPDNGQAVAGFVLSLVSVCLLFVSAGLSTIVSIGCAIAGIICSRNGKRKVDAGETPKHRGLAQAGYIIGWVGLALSIIATIAWIAIIATGISEDGNLFDPDTTRAMRQLVWG